jgi:hypothetical protein
LGFSTCNTLGWDRPWARISNQGRACTHALFLLKAALGFFHFLEIVTGWLVPSAGENIPVDPGWYIPGWKIPLDENRFLQAGKGPENTKEKSTIWCPSNAPIKFV